MQEDVLEKNLHFVLKTIGANCISMSDLASQRIKNENWLLTLMMDMFDYKIVLPSIMEFNAKALFFIITSKIGSPEYLNWGQAILAESNGYWIHSAKPYGHVKPESRRC